MEGRPGIKVKKTVLIKAHLGLLILLGSLGRRVGGCLGHGDTAHVTGAVACLVLGPN